jgi:hypothetical protein
MMGYSQAINMGYVSICTYMSNKGNKLSNTTKNKIGLARQEVSKSHLIQSGKTYLAKLESNPQLLPTLSGYCLAANIHRSTLLEHSVNIPEVAAIVETIEALQEDYLLTNGIIGKANPIFSIFLLKSKHQYKDQPQQLTQNNTFNISPDLLADALKLMGNNKAGE